MDVKTNGNKHCRIVLTGGPGGGKTTAAELFRRELGDCLIVVPESATTLFTGGFPRVEDPISTEYTQKAIYHVQKNLENVHERLYPNRTLLCDRGTIDGAVYWPSEDTEQFFRNLDTSLEIELSRYSGVIFFETAAVGGLEIEGGNPIRNESIDTAVEIDTRLRSLWSQHPNFHLVPHHESFIAKINEGIDAIKDVMNNL